MLNRERKTAFTASTLFTFVIAENVTSPAVVKCKYMQSEYQNLSNLLGAFLFFQDKYTSKDNLIKAEACIHVDKNEIRIVTGNWTCRGHAFHRN